MNNQPLRIFESKILLPVGAIAPDDFLDYTGREPSDDLVVSVNRDHTAASLYGDMIWDLSAYHPEHRPSTLNFIYFDGDEFTKSRCELIKESKWLVLALMWKKEGRALSFGTLLNYLTIIKMIARFSEEISCRVQDVLSNENQLLAFIEVRCNGWNIETLGSILPHLARIGFDGLGYQIVSDKLLREIRAKGRKYRETLKQHPPMPARIYMELLNNLSNEMKLWGAVSEEILSLAKAMHENDLLGRSKETQKSKCQKSKVPYRSQPIFGEIASKDVIEYIRAGGHDEGPKGLSAVIAEAQLLLKLIIQSFTGARDDEIISLPYECLEIQYVDGASYYIVLGRTTKLNGGKAKAARWVTNEAGFKAILAAQEIASTIFYSLGVDIKKQKGKTNEYPLFVSGSYLGLASKSSRPRDKLFQPGSLSLITQFRLRRRLTPKIFESDILELEQIDIHRDWRSEERFKIGGVWPFTTHQLRRSLALYATRSGLVSLPALRRQLQHITDAMARFYANGSAFAADFIGGNKDHFGLEWQRTQPESAFLGFVLKVMMSNSPLAGGFGKWVDRKFHNNTDTTILFDRTETEKQFKKGQISWKETFIGGCTTVEKCDKTAMDFLDIECISAGCKNQVIILPKLERVISIYQNHVNSLDPDSIEYRSESASLSILLNTKENMLKDRGV